MNLIKQAAILLGCLAVGEAVVFLTAVKLPSSIIGLFMLFALLKTKVIKVSDVDGVSSFLIKYMGVFFVPPCVALLNHIGVIKMNVMPLLVVSLASTVLVIFATGLTHQYLRSKQ